MSGTPRFADLAVVGAGPAGVEAAVTAAGHGLDVVLLDELPAAGGQIYRAPPAPFPAGGGGPDEAAGNALRDRLAASPVEAWAGSRVWSVLDRSALAAPDAPPMEAEAGFLAGSAARFRLDTAGAGGLRAVHAAALVLSPGAVERVVPFPGWTLPGVVGLAAATVLLKSQRLLPGRRVVVAGAGPLVPAVAAAIVKAGGTVVAAVDLAGPTDSRRRRRSDACSASGTGSRGPSRGAPRPDLVGPRGGDPGRPPRPPRSVRLRRRPLRLYERAWIAKLLADRILGREPAMPLFPPDRLLDETHGGAES